MSEALKRAKAKYYLKNRESILQKGATKKHCDLCGYSVCSNIWLRHTKTLTHQKNDPNYQPETKEINENNDKNGILELLDTTYDF